MELSFSTTNSLLSIFFWSSNLGTMNLKSGAKNLTTIVRSKTREILHGWPTCIEYMREIRDYISDILGLS